MEPAECRVVSVAAHEGELALVFRPSSVVAGEWSCCGLRLKLGPLAATIDASADADATWLREQLGALLSTAELTGVIEFGGTETDLQCVRIELASGKGSIAIRVEADHAADGGAHIVLTTDQAALGNAWRELGMLVGSPS